METQQQEPLSEVKKPGLGNVFLKIGEGWTCVITRTDGPDAGKAFVKCGENCTCTLDGETVTKEVNLPPEIVSSSGSGGEAFCKCGEGWSCEITRTEGPEKGSGKGFAECSPEYNCSCAVAAN